MVTPSRRWSLAVPGSRGLAATIAILSVLSLAGAFPARAVSCLGSNLTYAESGNNSADLRRLRLLGPLPAAGGVRARL